MIVELRDEDVREKAGPRHAARDRTARRRALHHRLVAPAGLLHSGDLDHLQPGRDQVEEFAHVLTDDAQFPAAFLAGVARADLAALTRCARRNPGPATLFALLSVARRPLLCIIARVVRGPVDLGERHLEALERQFELFDLAGDLLGNHAELLLLQPGDPDPKSLHEDFMGAQGGRHPVVLRLEGSDHRLQDGRIFR